MSRDKTLEERIESTLYTAGVHNSGSVASAIMETIEDYNGLAHDWGPSTLGHGNYQCRKCKMTDLEARAIGMHDECRVRRGE